MKSLEYNSETFQKDYIESISIKKQINNKYCLYALLRLHHKENGEIVSKLVAVKSYDLEHQKDFDFAMTFTRENNDVSYNNITLFSYDVRTQLLYNLKLVKNTGIAVELEVLNKEGDENMCYNIYEDLEQYVVQIKAAGLDKEDIRISLDENIITVEIRPIDHHIESEGQKIIHKGFDILKRKSCEIYLPNIKKVTSRLSEGILYVIVDKKNKAKKIEIE